MGRDAVITNDEMPRIDKLLRSQRPRTLVIYWRGGGVDKVDLSGLITRSKHFAVLADPELFATAKAVAFGGGVGWANGLDYSATNLHKMAEGRRPMTGRQFVSWQKKMGISNRETAALFDRTVSTVKNYHNADKVPMAVAATARSMMRDPVIFQAHFRPAPKAGRPRKTA